ncbi:HAD-IIIC family phosphatase [soil metagenome]
MEFALETLPWLPPQPEGLRQRCKALGPHTPNLGAELQGLATARLDDVAARTLGRTIERLRAEGADLAPLAPFRLGVLAAHTADLFLDGSATAAARHGVALELVVADYGQVEAEAFAPGSRINAARCDAVLLLVDGRWLGIDRPAPPAEAADRVSGALQSLEAVAQALRTHGGAATLLPTFAVEPLPLFGGLDRRLPGTPRALAERVNAGLAEIAARRSDFVFDLAGLVEQVGADRWFNPSQFHHYKLAFASEFNALTADHLGRLLGAVRGKARKVLALDLDNTVWGGVIGDDGLAGIVIGQGSARGEAHLAVQQLALDLRARGVVLAVSSKNDDATARTPFREHPDMLLKESDIAVFQANWQDKPSNLEAIAKALNLGLDALVFLDDNPAERAQVRAALPMVAVPELPADPSWYPRLLAAAGYFEAVTFSQEDLLRADAYAGEAQRREVIATARDLGDYLGGLGMTIRFAPFDPTGRARIAQLINKSNQFNLTTRRYTEAEVQAMEGDPVLVTLQTRLSDRFGDMGMIGVIIARDQGGGAWEIDTWLMSCRVLGRRVEEAMCAELMRGIATSGGAQVTGVYRPTPKNGMVAEHYPKLGFEPVEGPAGESRFLKAVGDGVFPEDLPFTVLRES